MRVGVLTDIHANIHALDRALDLLTNLGVDRIVCLGDTVEKGADGDAVVRRLTDWAIPTVRGNHDDNAVKHAGMPAELMTPDERPLKPETIATLQSWPLTREYLWADRFVLMAHGTPSKNSVYVFPGEQPKRLRKDLKRRRPDVLLLGHTHRPMCQNVEGTWILNPGSVRRGGRRDSYTCGVLSLPEVHFTVYDLATREPIDLSQT